MNRRTDFFHAPKLGWRLSIYPIIVIPMMVYLSVRDAKAETVRGMTLEGKAYICELKPRYPLLQFCVFFPAHRDRFGWPRL